MYFYQDSKMVKQVLIGQWWMFDKIQQLRKENVYKERSFNHSIIQSTFFFKKKYHVISTGMMFEYMELQDIQ